MAAPVAARIGPNAVIQMARAIEAFDGRQALARVFDRAGLQPYLTRMPEQMIPESEVSALQASLRAIAGDHHAGHIAWTAGHHTANYILAHRIPAPAQALLRLLPPSLAAPVLVKAIARHAWTFTGSGRFTSSGTRPLVLSVENCPLCRGTHATSPRCGFYAATFERLFASLVSGTATATEIECQAMGATACRFRIDW